MASDQYEGAGNDDVLVEGDDDAIDDRLDELESRVEELESKNVALATDLERVRGSAGYGGYGLGVVIAVVLSWAKNGSIIWCIVHGVFSWLYVVYFAFKR